MGMRHTTIRTLKNLSAGLLTALLLTSILPTSKTQAISAVSLAVRASTSSVTVGGEVTMTISVNTAGSATDARIRISYDAVRLSFVSADFTGLPLNQDFGSGNFTGYYLIDRGAFSNFPSGNFDVARITFRANQSGTAAVSIENAESSVGSADPVDNGAAHAPQTAGSTSISVTDPPASTPAPSSASKNKVTQQQATSNGLPTTPNSTVPSAAEQGLPDDQPVPVAAENVILDPGYAAFIRVVNDEGQAVEGISVTVGEVTKTTDSDGSVFFEGLAVGEYNVLVGDNEQTITITPDDKATPQEFQFTADANKSTDTIWVPAVIAIAAFALVFVGYTQRRRLAQLQQRMRLPWRKIAMQKGANMPAGEPPHVENDTISIDKKLESIHAPDKPTPEAIIEPDRRDGE